MNFSTRPERLLLPAGLRQPYLYYGVHGERRMSERVYTFRILLPFADSVSLVSGFTSWETGKKMTRLDGGVWECTCVSAVSLEGECYKYRASISGEVIYLADPFATREENGGFFASVIATEIPRVTPFAKSQKEEPIHLLEVSLASFMTRGNRLPYEEGAAPSYRELAEKLVIYAKSTGYTHIKLLPREVGEEFSYFAPPARYGSPEDFSQFVTVLHENGLRVLYSFYFPVSEWESAALLSAASFFLWQYAVDGIYFEECGQTPIDSFSEDFQKLAFYHPHALFMSDLVGKATLFPARSEKRERLFSDLFTTPVSARHAALSALLSALPLAAEFASQSKYYTRAQDTSLMESLVGSYEEKFAANRLYQLLLTVAKGPKLSFMGQSLAPFRPWRDDLLPEWYMADFKLHRAHRRYIRALNTLYLKTPLLYRKDSALSVELCDPDQLIFSLKLTLENEELLVIGNASDRHALHFPFAVKGESYREIFSSDEESFAGEGYVHRIALKARDGHVHLCLAPLSAVILQRLL